MKTSLIALAILLSFGALNSYAQNNQGSVVALTGVFFATRGENQNAKSMGVLSILGGLYSMNNKANAAELKEVGQAAVKLDKLSSAFLTGDTSVVIDMDYQAAAAQFDCEGCTIEMSNFLFSNIFQAANEMANDPAYELSLEDITEVLGKNYSDRNTTLFSNLYLNLVYFNEMK